MLNCYDKGFLCWENVIAVSSTSSVFVNFTLYIPNPLSASLPFILSYSFEVIVHSLPSPLSLSLALSLYLDRMQIDKWMDERMKMACWMDIWMRGCLAGWINGWTDGWIDKWVDGRSADWLVGTHEKNSSIQRHVKSMQHKSCLQNLHRWTMCVPFFGSATLPTFSPTVEETFTSSSNCNTTKESKSKHSYCSKWWLTSHTAEKVCFLSVQRKPLREGLALQFKMSLFLFTMVTEALFCLHFVFSSYTN